MSALYRSTQFFAAVKASLLPGPPLEQAALVRQTLTTPGQRRLFADMSPNDRRHALAVAHTLSEANYHTPALLQAALLHDVAKTIGQPIPHRVAIVLLEAFWPAALHRLSNWQMADIPPLPAEGGTAVSKAALSYIAGWRRPFVVHAHHPAIGAAWARQAGCPPLAVALIARHQERLRVIQSTEDKLLAALQWADSLN